MGNGDNAPVKKGWLIWLMAVAGWLVCAALCLAVTIGLEAWPQAWDMFFPAILLILFCNILLFLFITSRWVSDLRRAAGSVVRICVGEGLLLAGIYALGRFGIGN